MGTGGGRIGELVTMLERDAPQELARLRERFPDRTAELRGGEVMGDTGTDLGCAVTIPALARYAEAAEALLPRMRARLAWSWRFDLIAKLAAAAGSGGTVGALAAGASADKAFVTALIALVGSVCTLIFAYLQRDEAAGSVADSYNRMITALVSADELGRTLPALCSQGPSTGLEDAIGKANETARTLNELRRRFG
jgi:hypothetical protein